MRFLTLLGLLCLVPVAGPEDPRPVPFVSDAPEVKEQEVRFENEGVELAGTLFSPKGAKDGPALVVVQQAGTETRDNPLYVQIAETFNAIGYSVLLYDRRGTGESGGGPERPRFPTMAADAVAGKHAIAGTEAVHPERIGFWGVSQGGWLAMEAGAMSDPGFVISVSAPLTTPGEQMEVLAYNFVLRDYGEEAAKRALEARRAVMDDYFRGKRSYESARAVLAAIEEEPWFESAFLPTAEELPEDVEASSWIHEMDYDPVRAFEAVEAPLLFLLGEEDIDIPVERTLEIAASLEERDGREVVVIPGADHIMRIRKRDPADSAPDPAEPVVSDSPTYFMVMGEWVGRRVPPRE